MIENKDLDCQDCNEVLKKERGCEGQGIIAFYINEERIFTCPLKLVTHQTYEYLRAYRFYQKGLLPSGRSWLEESRKFLDAMAVIENEYGKLEQDNAEKQRKQWHKKRH